MLDSCQLGFQLDPIHTHNAKKCSEWWCRHWAESVLFMDLTTHSDTNGRDSMNGQPNFFFIDMQCAVCSWISRSEVGRQKEPW